jgi:hypothetical protein
MKKRGFSMTVAELESQLFELRGRYNSKIEDRIKDLTETGYFDTAEPDSCDNPDLEIEALEDWMLEIRERLVELKPEEYHFGRVLKSKTSEMMGKKYSRFGDNGYLVCNCCRGLFAFGSDNKEKTELGTRNKLAFQSCAEHNDREKVGEMRVLGEALEDICFGKDGFLKGKLSRNLAIEENQINFKNRKGFQS